MDTANLISEFNSSVSSDFSRYLKLVWVDPLRKFWAFELLNGSEYYNKLFGDPSFNDSIKLEILKNTIKGNAQDLHLIKEIPYGDIRLFQVTNIDVTENFRAINFDMNWEYLANMMDLYREISNDDEPYLTDYFQLEYMEVIDSKSKSSLPSEVIKMLTYDEGDIADIDEDVSICKYHLISNELNFYSLDNRDILRECIQEELLHIIDPNDEFYLEWDFKNHTLNIYFLGWC